MTEKDGDVYVVSTGMICPVGLSAASTCAAMRAGISMFEELPYRDNNGEPITGAIVPGLDLNLKLEDRLIQLLSSALTDCLNQVNPEPMNMIPLLVGLAEHGCPDGCAALGEQIVGLIEQKLNLKFHPKLSRAILSGHTAGFEALAIARELLQDRHIPACIVCSVDSYINAGRLWLLDQHWRLKTEENSDGVIPGEAAAAVVVQRQQTSSALGINKVVSLGFGQEKATILSNEPLLGLGLTEATKAALTEAGIQMHEVDFRIVDVTGESYGFKEQALVVARLYRVRRKVCPPLWHCAENIGETGAAAGIIQLVMASHAFEKNYASGEIAMCSTSADSGGRAVVVVSRNSSTPPEQ